MPATQFGENGSTVVCIIRARRSSYRHLDVLVLKFGKADLLCRTELNMACSRTCHVQCAEQSSCSRWNRQQLSSPRGYHSRHASVIAVLCAHLLRVQVLGQRSRRQQTLCGPAVSCIRWWSPAASCCDGHNVSISN
jgi:hypothetical protein